MADRGSTSGRLPISTMSTRKRMKQGSDTKRGFTRISIGDQIDRWMEVVLFLQSGGRLTRYPTARHICFQKLILALQFIYSTLFHQEAHLAAI